MADSTSNLVESAEQTFEQRPPIEAIAEMVMSRALKKALAEYSAANERWGTPLRTEQYAVLQDFLNTKGRHIAEDVATPLVRAMKK